MEASTTGNASPRFEPGFRISNLDIFVLVIGATATFVLGRQVWWWGYVIAMVVGHFFLFCNVFRISRVLEFAWSAAFFGMAGGTVVVQTPGWMITTIATLCVTIVVIAVEMCRASYHGIWWERINPLLPVWWEANAV